VTNTKDMQWIAAQLRERLPGVVVEVLKPGARGKTAGWTLDANYQDGYVVVQWTRSTGFGISAPRDTDLPFTEDVEYLEDADSTLRRIMHLLVTGEGVSPSVTLQELRKRRSISQEELAKVMRVSQASVSQTEQRDDILISTLRSVVGALGGRLVVKALFDDGAVEIKVDNKERVA
jgi:DNA-binding transcriptional regulator YdaS (Cro superfamily)